MLRSNAIGKNGREPHLLVGHRLRFREVWPPVATAAGLLNVSALRRA
jgi:hypothetical protein